MRGGGKVAAIYRRGPEGGKEAGAGMRLAGRTAAHGLAGEDAAKAAPMGNAIGGAEAARADGTSVADLRPQIAYTDLREWIEKARKLGEVREVKGLTWQTDIGMAAEVILHDENAPCVIFED